MVAVSIHGYGIWVKDKSVHRNKTSERIYMQLILVLVFRLG